MPCPLGRGHSGGPIVSVRGVADGTVASGGSQQPRQARQCRQRRDGCGTPADVHQRIRHAGAAVDEAQAVAEYEEHHRCHGGQSRNQEPHCAEQSSTRTVAALNSLADPAARHNARSGPRPQASVVVVLLPRSRKDRVPVLQQPMAQPNGNVRSSGTTQSRLTLRGVQRTVKDALEIASVFRRHVVEPSHAAPFVWTPVLSTRPCGSARAHPSTPVVRRRSRRRALPRVPAPEGSYQLPSCATI